MWPPVGVVHSVRLQSSSATATAAAAEAAAAPRLILVDVPCGDDDVENCRRWMPFFSIAVIYSAITDRRYQR